MYSMIVKKYGSPDVLAYTTAKEKPVPPKYVKISVVSAGVNFADILTIKGRYQERPRPPFSPGLEVSGIIVELGDEVKEFTVGEKVMADKRVTDWLQNGMTNGDLISGAVDRFFTTIKDTRE